MSCQVKQITRGLVVIDWQQVNMRDTCRDGRAERSCSSGEAPTVLSWIASSAWPLGGETGCSLLSDFELANVDKYVAAMLVAVEVTLDEDAEAASVFEDTERGEGRWWEAWGLALLTNILMVASLNPMSNTDGESGWTFLLDAFCLEIFCSWSENSAAAAGVSSGDKAMAVAGAPGGISPLGACSVSLTAHEGRLQFSSGGPIGLESCQPY